MAEEKSEIAGWFAGRLPAEWFQGTPDILADREEIVVIGRLAEPEVPEGADAEATRQGSIRRFREETREKRMRIAQEGQRKFGRAVSWGVKVGERTALFTHLSVPFMTRLRINERQLLDVLVDSGIARSRSDALAWCVRLVAGHQSDWIGELRQAMESVARVRAQGPKLN